MHLNTYKLMHGFKKHYVKSNSKILDVGSYNVNGTYKSLFQDCDYIGIDITHGSNVDIVCTDPYDYPFDIGSFDIVICGQVLEHTKHPWKLVAEIYRVVKIGGYVCLVAPWRWEIHRHPIDCFRILPDGMESLMSDAGFKIVHCGVSEDDCVGIGFK